MSASDRKSSRHTLRQEMTRSFLLPIALALGILLAGVLVALLAPWPFMTSIAVFIAVLLLLYLLWSTRGTNWRWRLLAILVAVPALVGISLGLVNGSVSATLLGFGVTLFLLALLRFFLTPVSYRAAYSRFRAGDMEAALRLVNKSIAARPEFWESYQLRALIYLAMMNLAHAAKDAQQAVALKPGAHPAYNTLGHIYLAQERFAEAEEAYGRALDLAPGNALYLYHLGLAEFRQGKYQDAAESFAAASQGTLPLVEYDLQNAYYLVRALEALGATGQTALAEQRLLKYAAGLDSLQEQLARQPQYAHLPQMQADLDDLALRLARLQAPPVP